MMRSLLFLSCSVWISLTSVSLAGNSAQCSANCTPPQCKNVERAKQCQEWCDGLPEPHISAKISCAGTLTKEVGNKITKGLEKILQENFSEKINANKVKEFNDKLNNEFIKKPNLTPKEKLAVVIDLIKDYVPAQEINKLDPKIILQITNIIRAAVGLPPKAPPPPDVIPPKGSLGDAVWEALKNQYNEKLLFSIGAALNRAPRNEPFTQIEAARKAYKEIAEFPNEKELASFTEDLKKIISDFRNKQNKPAKGTMGAQAAQDLINLGIAPLTANQIGSLLNENRMISDSEQRKDGKKFTIKPNTDQKFRDYIANYKGLTPKDRGIILNYFFE